MYYVKYSYLLNIWSENTLLLSDIKYLQTQGILILPGMDLGVKVPVPLPFSQVVILISKNYTLQTIGIASIQRPVGHNLVLPIWFDSRDTMELCVHPKHASYCWSTFINDFMHCVSNYSHYLLLKHHKVHCNLLLTIDACI